MKRIKMHENMWYQKSIYATLGDDRLLFKIG